MKLSSKINTIYHSVFCGILTPSLDISLLFSLTGLNIDEWTVQLGVTRRNSYAFFGTRFKVRGVFAHSQYNIGAQHDNDIALFQLKQKVKFNDHLLPVCLPPPNYELAPGTRCTVIGWGKREDTRGRFLQKSITYLFHGNAYPSWCLSSPNFASIKPLKMSSGVR